MDCQICCEKFTKRARKEVKCPSPDCDASYCLVCFKRYIMESEDIMPKCMGCSKELSYSFVRDLVPVSWANGDYLNRRTEHLMAREKSLLPESQEDVRKELDRRQCQIETERIEAEITKLTDRINDLFMEKTRIWDEHRRKFRTVAKERTKLATRRRCPVEDCAGFLDTNWKCGICETKCCSECGEVKNEEHECSEDAKATFKLIKSDTRPCPQCAIPIHKWKGCNQMYCTQCSCMFDYRTGQLENGRFFHNPHYFEAIDNGTIQRRTGNQQNMRCGMPDPYNFRKRLTMIKHYCNYKEKRSVDKVKELYRLVSHITNVTLREKWREDAYDNECKMWRRDYMLKELSEEVWMNKLKTVEKQREKNTEVRQLITLFKDIGMDCIINIDLMLERINDEMKLIPESLPQVIMNDDFVDPIDFILTQINEVDKIQGFINTKSADMEKKFKMKMPMIDSYYIPSLCRQI